MSKTFDVYVGNLPSNYNEAQIRDIFDVAGEISGVKIIPPRSGAQGKVAFVKFLKEADAQCVAQYMSNRQLPDGRSLMVRYRPIQRSESSHSNGPQVNGKLTGPKNEKEVKADEMITLYVSHVDSPIEFFGQLYSKELASKLEVLTRQMEDLCPNQPKVVGQLSTDLVYGCKYSLDGMWYRCRIQKCLPKNEVDVRYIDYGNSEVTDRFGLVTLPADIANTAPLCEYYRVDDLELVDKSSTSELYQKGFTMLSDLISEQRIELKIRKREKDTILVKIYQVFEGPLLDIPTKMMTTGSVKMKTSDNVETLTSPKEKKSPLATTQLTQNTTPTKSPTKFKQTSKPVNGYNTSSCTETNISEPTSAESTTATKTDYTEPKALQNKTPPKSSTKTKPKFSLVDEPDTQIKPTFASLSEADIEAGNLGDEPDTPTKSTFSPVNQPGTPTKPTFNLLNELGTPTKPTLSPVNQPGTPTKPTLSPANKPCTPTKPTFSPVNQPGTPTKPISSLVNERGTPTKPAFSLVNERGTPVNPTFSLVNQPGTPTKATFSLENEPSFHSSPLKVTETTDATSAMIEVKLEHYVRDIEGKKQEIEELKKKLATKTTLIDDYLRQIPTPGCKRDVFQVYDNNADEVGAANFMVNRTDHMSDHNMKDNIFNEPKITFQDLGGCHKEIAQIKELIELPLYHAKLFEDVGIKPARGILLYGPPGTGKTLIARAVGNEAKVFFKEIYGPIIASGTLIDSNKKLTEAFEEAQKNRPAIIFFDGIDTMAPKNETERSKVVVLQILSLWNSLKDKSEIILLAAMNKYGNIDPALKRYGLFESEINISAPDVHGRLEILRILTKNMNLHTDVSLKMIAEQTVDYVGVDLASLCNIAGKQGICRKLADMQGTKERGFHFDNTSISPDVFHSLISLAVQMDDFKCALSVTRPLNPPQSVSKVPTITWDDIGGMANIKAELQEFIQYSTDYSDKVLEIGMTPPRGVLLYGPSGCGKTLLAKAFANQCKCNFITIKGYDFLSTDARERKVKVKDVLEKVRNESPCVLFIHKMDVIMRTPYGITDQVIDHIISEVDDILEKTDAFIIGSANSPGKVHPSFQCSGRLDYLIHVPLPSEVCRASIFEGKLWKVPKADEINSGYLTELAKSTKGFSGREVVEICHKVCKLAIKESIRNQMKRKDKEKCSNTNKVKELPRLRRKHFSKVLETIDCSFNLTDTTESNTYGVTQETITNKLNESVKQNTETDYLTIVENLSGFTQVCYDEVDKVTEEIASVSTTDPVESSDSHCELEMVILDDIIAMEEMPDKSSGAVEQITSQSTEEEKLPESEIVLGELDHVDEGTTPQQEQEGLNDIGEKINEQLNNIIKMETPPDDTIIIQETSVDEVDDVIEVMTLLATDEIQAQDEVKTSNPKDAFSDPDTEPLGESFESCDSSLDGVDKDEILLHDGDDILLHNGDEILLNDGDELEGWNSALLNKKPRDTNVEPTVEYDNENNEFF